MLFWSSAVKSIYAIFGSSDRQSKTRSKIIIDRISSVGDPDIALLHTIRSVTLSNTIKIIRLPGIPKENFGYENYGITSIGWGSKSTGKFLPIF